MTRFGEHAGRFVFTSARFDIYHNPEEDPATEDEWHLMVRPLRKERKLGISRFRETELDEAATRTIADLFRQAGIELRRTE